MNHSKIVFIGGGNMGACLIAGLIDDGYPADRIHVIEPDQSRGDQLQRQFSIQAHTDLIETIKDADAVLLAVKPQIIQSVLSGFQSVDYSDNLLFISIAAGIRTADMGSWLGARRAIVRTMPNTPAMIGAGATALFATDSVSEKQKEIAESIMRAAGVIQWITDESLMDAVTAISGSGPAYFFRIMEAMESSGIELGLSSEQARLLVIQTAFGAAKMALESPLEPAQLRAQVTSPGGTTEKALAVLNDQNIDRIIHQTLTAARDRSTELANNLGDS